MKDFQFITNAHPGYIENLYKDFVKDPDSFIKRIMEFVQLPSSKNVERYMEEMIVTNRNVGSQKKKVFSDEIKQRILEIVS